MANEKRLIDANALIEHMKDLPRWEDRGYFLAAVDYPEGMFEPEDVISSIKNAPTVDAVPVVRCKGCKQYNGHRYCTYFAETVLDDDFCSYGERREGNG